MDIYLFCFCLGFLGFAVMTLLGLSHTHGDGPHSAPTTHSHDTAHACLGHANHGHHTDHGPSSPKPHVHDGKTLWLLLSPRALFSLLLGFGATGLILRGLLNGPILLTVAVLGAWFFHRYVVEPLWRFFFRFASAPARTLESAVLEQAEAVANFDSHGQGLVALQLDGQIVQMLGKLNQQDREQGVRVRSGDRLMIVEVDPRQHSCTVTRLRSVA